MSLFSDLKSGSARTQSVNGFIFRLRFRSLLKPLRSYSPRTSAMTANSQWDSFFRADRLRANSSNIIVLLLLLLLMTFIRRKLCQRSKCAQVSRCMITVILEQEHFQSFPEHWQWNVQQTGIGWKTVPHDWPMNGSNTCCRPIEGSDYDAFKYPVNLVQIDLKQKSSLLYQANKALYSRNKFA